MQSRFPELGAVCAPAAAHRLRRMAIAVPARCLRNDMAGLQRKHELAARGMPRTMVGGQHHIGFVQAACDQRGLFLSADIPRKNDRVMRPDDPQYTGTAISLA